MKAAKTIAVDSGGNTLYLDISKIDGYRVDYNYISMDIFLNGQVIHVDVDNVDELVKFSKSILEE